MWLGESGNFKESHEAGKQRGKLGIDLTVLVMWDGEEGWDSGYIVKVVSWPSMFAKLLLIRFPLQVCK